MLVIGLIGFAMKKFDVPREPLVLGLVLGTMAEGELARSMALVQGSVPALLLSMVTRPISIAILVLTALSIFKGLRSQGKSKKTA
jgi:putative tricarboxylic transport membrane protein